MKLVHLKFINLDEYGSMVELNEDLFSNVSCLSLSLTSLRENKTWMDTSITWLSSSRLDLDFDDGIGHLKYGSINMQEKTEILSRRAR